MSNFIQNFKALCSEAETPTEMIEAAAAFTIASVCDKKFYLEMGHVRIDTSLYIMAVGPQGVGKSVGLDLGLDLIKKNSDRNNMITTCAVSSRALKDEIERIGSERETKGSDFDRMELYKNYDKIDATSVSIAPDEAAEHFAISKEEMVGLYTEAYNTFKLQMEHLTAHHGKVYIEKPYINFYGPCVPEWLAGEFKDQLLDKGFGRRCIWVVGMEKRFSNPLPKRTPEINRAELLCHNRLLDILNHKGGKFKMTPQAEDWYVEWYKENDKIKDHVLQVYYGNKRMHLIKLAMIHSLAEKDELRIDVRDFLAANEYLERVEENMHIVFQGSGANSEFPIRIAVLDVIKNAPKKELNWTSIIKNTSLNKKYKRADLKEALDALEEQEEIQVLEPDGERKFRMYKYKKGR